MTTGDIVFGLIALALWAAVGWRALRTRATGPLWWATACVAAAVTTKIGLLADPFNRATGGIYLDELLGHLLGVTAGTLILARLVRMREHSDRLLTRGAPVLLVLLSVTWFLGPVYDIPAEADWIPEPVLRSPALVAHYVLLDVFLVAFAVGFVRAAGALVRSQAAGAFRRSLQVLAPAAGALALSALLGLAGRVVAVGTGATPPWLYTVQNGLLAIVFVLFTVAVAISGSTALWNRTGRPATA